ncbi:Beta-catenin-like protein 1 [Gaertneriomyces sp. JEL0708]|nr:Beta-catenin-like protein 1 [Gaertneriomyces sp. JEL0708]
MDVNSIFKVPAPVIAGNKRKLPDAPSDAFLKKLKTDDDGEDYRLGWGPGSGAGSSSRAQEHEGGENSSNEFEDEEDARFHGDGLDADHKNILDIVDSAEDTPAQIDAAVLKKTVLRFEKAVNKNQEMRVKYPDQPLKFIDSEADLDEEIKNMLQLSAAPELYPLLVELQSHASVLSLLTHENTDISIAALELLNELTDEDLVSEASEETAAGMLVLVRALLDAEILSLLVTNLARLDATNSDDSSAIFVTLSIIENMISTMPEVSETVVNKTTIIQYLLVLLTHKPFSSTKQYASELLAILCQSSRSNRLALASTQTAVGNGIDTLLRAANLYKKRDPTTADEIELMENVFDTLSAAVHEPEVKTAFLESEGLELLLLMMKEKRMSRMRALKLLNHALLLSPPLCDHFVEIMGLGALFPLLMHKGLKKYRKEYKSFSETEFDEHVISVLGSLFRHLTNTEYRGRLMLKFLESDFEKTDRLIELWTMYRQKVVVADREISQRKTELQQEFDNGEIEKEELQMEEEELELRRLDAGLFTLYGITFIVSYVCVGEAEGDIRKRVEFLLDRRGDGIQNIVDVLQEYRSSLGGGTKEAEGEHDNNTNATKMEKVEEEDMERRRVEALIQGLTN